METSKVISAERVCVTLSGRNVIENASLRVDRGEFIGLLGLMVLARQLLALDPGPHSVSRQHRSHSCRGLCSQRHDVEWDFYKRLSRAPSGRTHRTYRLVPTPQARGSWGCSPSVDQPRRISSRRPIAQLSGGQRQRYRQSPCH